MNKVLYISYDGLTDQLGQSQILPYILGLKEQGYAFSIISFEKQNGLYSFDYVQQILNAHGIKWYPLSYTKRPPVLSTVYDVIRLNNLAFSISKKEGISIVHCRSYISALIGLKLKRKLGLKFIFDMRGFWADERVDGKLWNISNPIFKQVYRYFKRKEANFLEESDHTISLTQAGKDEMQRWKNANQFSPISIIPCCVDTIKFAPNKVEDETIFKLKSELGFEENNRILLYLGSVGTWYMLDEMLLFFKEAYKRDISWRFLFLSKEQELVKSRAAALHIDLELITMAYAQRDDIPAYIALSNWGIFFIKPSYSKKSSSPTKQGELMSMGLPVVINKGVGDCDQIVKKYGAGIAIEGFSSEAINSGIDAMNSFELNRDAIRAGAEDYFSLDSGVSKYLNVYQQLKR